MLPLSVGCWCKHWETILLKMPIKVLVTGGTGLVGSAIKHIVEQEKVADEEWVFCSSKDANLR